MLKPCPFCGGAEFDITGGDSDVSVQCEGCLATGPVATVGCRGEDDEPFDIEVEAKEMWNERASALALVRSKEPGPVVRAHGNAVEMQIGLVPFGPRPGHSSTDDEPTQPENRIPSVPPSRAEMDTLPDGEEPIRMVGADRGDL